LFRLSSESGTNSRKDNPWRGGVQTVLVGGLAAAVAFTLARSIG
jgi:hypothetical protein